jgi:hypothetical protein
MTPKEKLTVWATSYNAALTGILSGRTSQAAAASGDIDNISRACRSFADRALKDAEAHRQMIALNTKSS